MQLLFNQKNKKIDGKLTTFGVISANNGRQNHFKIPYELFL